MKYLIIYLIIINIITFIMYFLDKFKAKYHWYRTPEKILLFLGGLGGCVGGLLGMYIFRHKTKKIYFYVINYLFLIIWIGCIILIISKK